MAKHNKKRNTAFLFEALVREMTKAAIRGDNEKKKKVLKVIKEHFGKGTILHKELQLYKSIYETKEVDELTAAKIIVECRNSYHQLDKKEVFKRQSFLISEVNKTITPRVYNNYVPNYRSLASIAQLFSDETVGKTKVLLETNLLKEMTGKEVAAPQVKGMDEFTFKQYVKVFNREYSSLLPEQREVLSLFIADHTGLVSFLNEELGRLKGVLTESLDLPEIKEDEVMVENTQKVIDILENVGKQKVNENTVIDVLKIQKLVSEIQSDDN